jgi:hypothetical protein
MQQYVPEIYQDKLNADYRKYTPSHFASKKNSVTNGSQARILQRCGLNSIFIHTKHHNVNHRMSTNNLLNKTVFLGVALLLVLTPLIPKQATALSCLSTAEYIQMIAGDDETIIFTGTVDEKIDTKSYTAEVITVTDALQGYIEDAVFVYHRKDETWGYLCNAGPSTIGSSNTYITTRDALGKYQVSQRIGTNDPLQKVLTETLAKKEMNGVIYPAPTSDRLVQLLTTITDTLAELKILLAEYAYWKKQ